MENNRSVVARDQRWGGGWVWIQGGTREPSGDGMTLEAQSRGGHSNTHRIKPHEITPAYPHVPVCVRARARARTHTHTHTHTHHECMHIWGNQKNSGEHGKVTFLHCAYKSCDCWGMLGEEYRDLIFCFFPNFL